MGVLATLDPTALFCLFCIVIPMYKEPTTTDADRIAFLCDPYFLFCCALVVLPALLVRVVGTVSLSEGDRMKARWYLWNGAIIHVMMDGGVGSLKQLPLFVTQYKILDARFRDESRWEVPELIGLVELTAHAFFCILVYYGYRTGAHWTLPMEILACTLHIAGAILFILDEHMHGYPNIVSDPNFEFKIDQIIYFWFGFGANYLWIVLPAYLIWSATRQIAAAMAVAKDAATARKRK